MIESKDRVPINLPLVISIQVNGMVTKCMEKEDSLTLMEMFAKESLKIINLLI